MLSKRNISDQFDGMRNHDYWVYILNFRNVNDAIACEKKLKGWRRARKIVLIEKMNPRWLDLGDEWEQQPKLYDRPWKTEEMI